MVIVAPSAGFTDPHSTISVERGVPLRHCEVEFDIILVGAPAAYRVGLRYGNVTYRKGNVLIHDERLVGRQRRSCKGNVLSWNPPCVPIVVSE
jgi:hypothetical protein